MNIREFLSETKNLVIISIVLQVLIIFGLAFFYFDNLVEIKMSSGEIRKMSVSKSLPIILEGEQVIINGLTTLFKSLSGQPQ
jgi:hypothetical protein